MNIKAIKDMQYNASHAAAFLKKLAHPDRLLILCQLVTCEKNVGELQAHTALSQSALSQHLAVLRNSNLVKTRKEAQMVYYQLADQKVEKILGTLYEIYCNPTGEQQ